jgi:DNA invertase Pin-like site-specific DNA recombinase
MEALVVVHGEPIAGSLPTLASVRKRAAQYVRMSTEHQKYSTANQAEAILRYAARRGMEIIETYADEGRSGLRADNRPGLQRLLADVQSAGCSFDVILVYDVSRWGRFQDADESAYYEYICRRAGLAVHYCAEQFENDGSPISTIVKGVKRAMAGEYSRELSAKVFIGHCRLVERGYWQGGPTAFGLRRQLVSEQGTAKGQLNRGEHKSLQTDRIVVVPGPTEEVNIVRRIYKAFVRERKTERAIASELNAQNLMTARARPWSRGAVRRILKNEAYIGNYVWNRSSSKLGCRQIRNRSEMLIRADAAFEPILDTDTFKAAQATLEGRKRSRRRSDEEMLDCLRRLGVKYGYLSQLVVDEAEHAPSSSSFQQRFGSLTRAFTLVGYPPARDYRYVEINRTLRAVHAGLVATAVAGIERAGGFVRLDRRTQLLTINDEFTAAFIISRCKGTQRGRLRWSARLNAGSNISIVARMDVGNIELLDYYLLPRIDFVLPDIRFAERNSIALDCYRFGSLEPLFSLSTRASTKELANDVPRSFECHGDCDRQNSCSEPASTQS